MRDYEEEDAAFDASKTVMEVDFWNVLQARRILGDFAKIKKATANEFDAELVVADFHTAFFEYEPAMKVDCSDYERAAFFERMLNSPAYAETHANSAGDLAISELATIEMVEVYESWKDHRRQFRKMPSWVRHANPQERQEREIESAIAEGIRKAEAAASEMEDIYEAFGLKGEPGMGYSTAKSRLIDLNRARELAAKISRNRRLKKIIDMAGPMRLLVNTLQGRKGRGDLETVSVGLAESIENAVPAELAMLACQQTKFDAVARMATGGISSFVRRSRDDSGKGGIAVVTDESGSMDCYMKAESAKALAMTIGYMARRQKRWIAFVSYSGGHPGRWHVMPPNKWDQEGLLDFLAHFYGGGTDCDVPIVEMPNVYWPEFLKAGMPRKATDLIFITDAIARPKQHDVDNFVAWKKAENVKLHTLLIDGDGDSMRSFSDTLFHVPAINVQSEGVRHVLSL